MRRSSRVSPIIVPEPGLLLGHNGCPIDKPCPRPVVRWHGGKYKLAAWIIAFFPKHDTYVEHFGGGASVMLNKPRSKAELYNDLDDVIVGLFRVLRDPAASARLVELLRLTPFSRSEFAAAYGPSEDPIENARRTIVRSFMGYGSDGTTGVYRTGFRCTVTSTKKLPAKEWDTYPDALLTVIERLRGVVIESTDALKLMTRMDSPGTLHFCDPPYLPETRSQGNRRRGAGFHVYSHELSLEDHIRMLEILKSLAGMVVLCGYPSELYDESLVGWRRVERGAYADGGRARTEVVWINPAAVAALEHGPLFA